MRPISLFVALIVLFPASLSAEIVNKDLVLHNYGQKTVVVCTSNHFNKLDPSPKSIGCGGEGGHYIGPKKELRLTYKLEHEDRYTFCKSDKTTVSIGKTSFRFANPKGTHGQPGFELVSQMRCELPMHLEKTCNLEIGVQGYGVGRFTSTMKFDTWSLRTCLQKFNYAEPGREMSARIRSK